MKKCTKKCIIKNLPSIIFAIIIIGVGASGKLIGTPGSIAMFTELSILGKSEAFGRILVGLGQLAAGVGVLFNPTRKISAVLGMAIMGGAAAYHLAGIIPGSPALAIAMFILATIIFFQKCDLCSKSKTCSAKSGTCSAE